MSVRAKTSEPNPPPPKPVKGLIWMECKKGGIPAVQQAASPYIALAPLAHSGEDVGISNFTEERVIPQAFGGFLKIFF